MTYRRVTQKDRLQLKAFLSAELNQSEIASKLGLHKSTISRELKRNTGGRGYRPAQAERLACARQTYRYNPRRMTQDLLKKIDRKIRLRWSPEQISNRLRVEGQKSVSSETIYTHVYRDRKKGGDLWRYLRWSRRQRKRRFPREETRGKIKDATPISERSARANENRIGVLRQYLPKKTELSKLHGNRLRKIEFEINNRPMKCLDWRTPYEAMLNKSCTTDW